MGFALENIVIIAGINEWLKSSFCAVLSHCFSIHLNSYLTLVLVVSGGYLPGSLRGSEKLLNNQWY